MVVHEPALAARRAGRPTATRRTRGAAGQGGQARRGCWQVDRRYSWRSLQIRPLEARAPAFEKRVNRRGALTERGRDFRNGEAVEIAEDERSPLRGRDGGERGQSAVAIFLTTLVERDLAELGVRLERRLPLDPLLLAVMIEQLVPVVGSSRRSAEGRARRSRETLPGQDRAPRPLRRRAPSMRSRTCHSLRRTERHVFIAVRKEGETILRPAVAR